MSEWDHNILSQADFLAAVSVIGARIYGKPDLTIAALNKDGEFDPYLFRWHVTPRSKTANDYLHVQVASDPERPRHNHPWPSMSVIMSDKGYDEEVQRDAPDGPVFMHTRVKGQTIFRTATEAHRLILPEGVPYVMTRFMTGSATGYSWGFWIGQKWFPYQDCTRDMGEGRSVFFYPPGTKQEDHT